MPLGNAPTPLDELEQGFGVTANAEELVRANHARMTEEQRAGGMKPVNYDLTEQVREDPSKLEDHAGVELAPENITVRGTGGNAIIQYVYVGARDSNEKGYVPYVEVYGDSKARKARAQRVAEREDPNEAAQRAADERIRKADEEAADRVREAQEKAEKILADAREKAEKELAKAREEAEESRAAAAEEAQQAADKAREESEKAKAKSGESGQRQRRSGSGGSGGSQS